MNVIEIVEGGNPGSGSIGYDPNLYQDFQSIIIIYYQKLNPAWKLFSWWKKSSWTNGEFEQQSVTVFCQVFLRCLQGNKFALSTLMAVSTLKITEIFKEEALGCVNSSWHLERVFMQPMTRFLTIFILLLEKVVLAAGTIWRDTAGHQWAAGINGSLTSSGTAPQRTDLKFEPRFHVYQWFVISLLLCCRWKG